MKPNPAQPNPAQPTCRLATHDDLPALLLLITDSINELQQGFLDPQQVAASHAIMGIDSQLIDDSTYYLALIDGQLAGCGGWSRRATLYGGDHSAGRNASLLDPAHDPARIRAMYTHPTFTRRGVGRLILARCEAAAAAEGFATLELMATMAGQPLYAAAGYCVVEKVVDSSSGVDIPLLKMRKPVAG